MRVIARSLVGSWMLLVLTTAGVAAVGSDLRLVDAAKSQNKQAVSALLKQKVDVNIPTGDGTTAIHWAAQRNDVDIADMLIHAGANVNVTNSFGVTPLSLACTNASAKMVEMLTAAGADVNHSIATGEVPIMTCARTGNVDAVNALIAHGANVGAKEALQSQTALMWAVAEHHPAVVRTLIDHGADIQARTKNGFTALHFAAREGEIEGAKMLLAAGVDVNIKSQKAGAPAAAAGGRGAGGRRGGNDGPAWTQSDGSTPLLVATMRAQVPFALFLLDKGADPNANAAGITALHWAVGTWEGEQANPKFGFSEAMSGIPDRKAKLELVKALLAHGADPNARATRNVATGYSGGFPDVPGSTPFILASYTTDLEVMHILLDAGADPKLKSRQGYTALMAASAVNRQLEADDVTEDQTLAAAKLLLDLGVDAAAVNANNETALHGVCYLGWNRMVQLLVDHGANVNAVSKPGLTPWLIAEGHGDRQGGVNYNKETGELLLKLGADPKLGHPCMAQGKCGVPDDQ